MRPSRIAKQDSQAMRYPSRPVKTPDDIMNGPYATEPQGLYKQRARVDTGPISVSSEEFDLEFYIPFDDDVEADEAEIIIYNLSTQSINQLEANQPITVTAGYASDTGIIFSGFISYVVTRKESRDKITKIYAVDDMSRKARKIENQTFAKNSSASYILRTLCNSVGLPVAAFSPQRDYVYTKAVTIDGELMSEIRKYAKVCGVSAYIHKGNLYIRSLSEGDNLNFTVSAETGLISIAEFTEEETSEDFEDVITGFDIEMLLQHRIGTASIINVNSVNFQGQYRVREGTHEYDGSNFTTTMRVV